MCSSDTPHRKYRGEISQFPELWLSTSLRNNAAQTTADSSAPDSAFVFIEAPASANALITSDASLFRFNHQERGIPSTVDQQYDRLLTGLVD
jgi:hypothetical protein